MQPERAWYASELAQRLGVPSSSLQRELQDLTEAGILKTHKQGRMVYYQANRESPVFPDLRGLLLKTAGLVDVLTFTSSDSNHSSSRSDALAVKIFTKPTISFELSLRIRPASFKYSMKSPRPVGGNSGGVVSSSDSTTSESRSRCCS